MSQSFLQKCVPDRLLSLAGILLLAGASNLFADSDPSKPFATNDNPTSQIRFSTAAGQRQTADVDQLHLVGRTAYVHLAQRYRQRRLPRST